MRPTNTNGTENGVGLDLSTARDRQQMQQRQQLEQRRNSSSFGSPSSPGAGYGSGGDSGPAAATPGRQAVAQTRESHAALQKALRDAQSGKEQVDYLQSVLENSRQYGRDVEAAIEHLANLLHKKTIECENLRALANENYAPLRNAVRTQFETTVKQEARQQSELRHLQGQIDSLLGERSQLQQEIGSLKSLVKELEGAPPHASYNPADKNLLFNRMAGDLSGGGTDDQRAPNYGSSNGNADGAAALASWNLAASPGAALPGNAAQRELMALLSTIDEVTSTKLDKSGMFDALKVICGRMCTQAKGMPTGHYPPLTEVLSQVLRERRDASGGGAHALQVEASGSIPQVQTSDRQRCTNLFLANRPNDLDDLTMLLATYEGREGELYARLKTEFEQAGGGDVDGGRRPADLKPVDHGDRVDTTTELHARIMIMYRKYQPNKIGSRELNDVLAKYPPELVLNSLVEKYGPEPQGEERRMLIQGIA
jgi:hypothetical protein